MKTALLIINPNAGKKSGKRDAAYITERLKQKGYHCEHVLCDTVDALDNQLQHAIFTNYEFVGIVGGDGSMHAFINAVLKTHEQIPVPLALFPCGTGNAFNLDIGCNSIDETLSCIFTNTTSYIDIAEMKMNKEVLWSFNIIGCGLVAEINLLAEKLRWLGAMRYNVASLIKLLGNPNYHLNVSTEHATFSDRYSFVLACNTRYTGKGMMMAPHALLNDGKFDVTLVKACSVFTLLRLFPKIFSGKHLGDPVIHYVQTNSLTVSAAPLQLKTNIDGEINGETPFSLVIHREKVKVFVSANS